MTTLICEGCGRAPASRDVYCTACGRELPGRQAPAAGDAAPPGWLVAAGPRGEGGLFEPLPSVPVSTADPLAPRRAWPGATGAVAAAAVAELEGEDDWAPEGGAGDTVVTLAGGPGWRVRESARPRVPLPPTLRTAAEAAAGEAGFAAAGGAGALVAGTPRPPLRALYVPLLALVLLSSCGAVALLVLHVLLHR